MELIIILLLGGILLGLEIFTHFRRHKAYKELTDLAGSATIAIARLEKGNRYILSLPETLSDSEFTEAVVVMKKSLDLKNSTIHIVIVQGNVTVGEFT